MAEIRVCSLYSLLFADSRYWSAGHYSIDRPNKDGRATDGLTVGRNVVL